MKKLKEILLVDDDMVNNFISEKLILKLGITEKVVIKKNGKEALDHIKSHCQPNSDNCPQFIIFDYNMPIMDGLEFLKELHHLNLNKSYRMAFILLAVQIQQKLLNEFIELGIQNYTFKPLNEEIVMETYRKYWNREGVWIG